MEKMLPGGFPEYTPDKQAIENTMRDTIRANYQKFGYVNIETPAIEANKVLMSKWWDEISKQIFGLYWLKQWWDDLKDFSLHFDLTVPLARYVVDHEHELKFPFKRYQIQKVWRWERQQKWRFKEFTQCDVDVIWENLSVQYDTEVIHTLYTALDEVFESLDVEKECEVHINNRKFIDSICEKFEIIGADKKSFYSLLDNYYKLDDQEFVAELKILTGNNFQLIKKILSSDIDELENHITSEWVSELIEVFNDLKSKWVNVLFDPYITRWLDYYTGTVFETFITSHINFWSICSGGRFDNLVESVRAISARWKKWKTYGWVWGSIWLSRLFARLYDRGFLDNNIPLSDVLIFNLPGSNNDYKNQIADLLRCNNVNTDVYYEEDKLGKQFAYADSKNIPIGIFAGPDEQLNNEVIIKDLDTRDSLTVSVTELIEYIRNRLRKI